MHRLASVLRLLMFYWIWFVGEFLLLIVRICLMSAREKKKPKRARDRVNCRFAMSFADISNHLHFCNWNSRSESAIEFLLPSKNKILGMVFNKVQIKLCHRWHFSHFCGWAFIGNLAKARGLREGISRASWDVRRRTVKKSDCESPWKQGRLANSC